MKCVVPGCQKTIVSGRFHYFPVNNAHLCRTWLQSVRNPEYCEETELKVISQDRLMVCSEHFLPADYEGTCLKGDAVPSVFPWSPVQEQSEKQDEPPRTEEEPNQQGVTEVTEKSTVQKGIEVFVNKQRLLELFRSCTVCLIECCVDIEVHEKLFAVIQDCQSCGHHRVWRSQPNPDDQPQDLSKSSNEKQDVQVEDAVEARGKKCKQELPEKGELPTNEDEPIQRGVITRAAEKSSVQKSTEVLVNKRCLLELFRSCTVCLVECCVDLEDHEKLFSVTQDCQSCGHHRVWWSQPNSADQDQKKSSDENHDHAAPYIKVKVGVKRRKQVVARTGSANQKGGKKSGKKMLVDVGGLCSSSADKSFIQKMQEMKKRRKLMMKKQDGSEGLEPCLDEDLLKTLKEDGELKLVIWCTECLSDASHSCFLHQHKNIVFCCAWCSDANDFENKDFEKLVRFEDLASFQTHAEKEHGAKAIHKLCQECGKFVVADPESRGMTGHKCQPMNKHLACPECGKNFSTKMGLKRHYSIIHEIQEHPCKYCLMIFKKRLLKLEHEQSHPQEEQPYSCPECPEKFDNIHKRNGHLKSHRDRQKHPCDTCKKSFKNIVNLEKHKVIHFGEQPLQCQNAVVEPRRTKGKEMSMELKQTIVDLRSQQKSIRVIAKMLDLSRSAVAYIVNKQLRTGHVTNKRRSGRPKKTTPEDDQMIMSLMTKNPLTTIRQIRNELMVIGRDVSATTIRRKLHTLNPSECHTATKSDVENLTTDGLKLQLVTNKTVLVGQKMLTEKFLD